MISNLYFGSIVNTVNTSSDLPSGSSSNSASKNNFSIYGQNIRFDLNQDYTSNYCHDNTKELPNAPPPHTNTCTSYINPINPLDCHVELLTNENNNESMHFNHNISNSTSPEDKSSVLKSLRPKPFIDDLHNYSKSCFDEISNYNQKYEKYEDYDEEDEELEEIQDNTAYSKDKTNKLIPLTIEDKLTPEHHARRPMNAFLIFCKRHRAIVREKYPNLENRAITKILGDWWANIDTFEKFGFTNLAKQYKDAFFHANPTFQWYKLPAPPLRSLQTRPRNADRSILTCGQKFRGSSSHHSTEAKTPRESMFTLADEAQMGSLNSLMGDLDGTVNFCSGSIHCMKRSKQRNVVFDRGLDPNRAFSKTNSNISKTVPSANIIGSDINAKRVRSNCKSNGTTELWTGRDSIVTSPQIDFERFVQANLAVTDNIVDPDLVENCNHSPRNDDQRIVKKTSRACKGKRYLEFINTVKVASVVKKNKTGDFLKHPTLPSTGTKVEYKEFDHMYATSVQPNVAKDFKPQIASKFNATDFDLDEKINSLIALDLDTYLTRKRDNKKKKKVLTKRNSVQSIIVNESCSQQNIKDFKEQLRRTIAGSQKRKARKESITRRDIAIAAESIKTDSILPEEASSDLLILAEVASSVTN